MIFEIKHKWSGEILFSLETESFKLCVEAAIKSRANLSEANLSEANLSRADLSEANLSRANLSEANLSEANLFGANLSRADLFGANLSRANLFGANLSRANLSEANLSGEQLIQFRDDFWAVLSGAPREVSSLREAIVNGKIDGSAYDGDCACLVGTIEKVANIYYGDHPLIKPNPYRPAESFFLLIKQGDTPETSKWSKMVLEWLDTWLLNIQSAFGESKGASKVVVKSKTGGFNASALVRLCS